MTPLDYFSSGTVKEKFYANKLKTNSAFETRQRVRKLIRSNEVI